MPLQRGPFCCEITYDTAMIPAERVLDFNLTINTPHRALTGGI